MKIIGIVLITITILAIIILIKKKRKEKAKRKYIAVETTSFKKEKRQKLKDPIEETNYFKKILPNVEKELEEQLKNIDRRRLGWCHIYWKAKKELLKNKYGIDWKSPSEMNPDCEFD